MIIKITNKQGKLLKRFTQPAIYITKCERRLCEITRGRSDEIVDSYYAYCIRLYDCTKTILNNIQLILDYYNIKYTIWYSTKPDHIEIKEDDIINVIEELKKLI